MLEINKLTGKKDGKEILKGIDLNVKSGEIHLIMGPNGSGKSTFAEALIGKPGISLSSESIIKLDGTDITDMEVNERAKAGLFVAFQQPIEVPGVPLLEFMRISYNTIKNTMSGSEISPFAFKKLVLEKCNELDFNPELLGRSINENLSGGEKKKSEILQLSVLEPKYAVLDEIDSGLDVTAIKIIYNNIKYLKEKFKIGMIIITHNPGILKYIEPDKLHIFKNGKIIKSGGLEIVNYVNENGYDSA